MKIYLWSFSRIYFTVIIVILIWSVLGVEGKSKRKKRLRQFFNTALFMVAIYEILSYTVLNRTPSDNHIFTFCADYSNEFYREMVMNAFLYFPFGLTLSTLIGPVSILIGFILSVTIESWQYIAGSGVAQGTDVIMNTLGCAIGAVPWILVKTGVAEKVAVWAKQRMKQ